MLEDVTLREKTITRAAFIKGVATGGALGIGSAWLGNRLHNTPPQATPTPAEATPKPPEPRKPDSVAKSEITIPSPKRQPTQESRVETDSRSEVVSSIRVYGLNEKITVKEDMLKLTHFLDQEFDINLKDKMKSENKEIPKSDWDKRKESLNPRVRYLEVCVKRSLWEKFKKEEQENTGENLASWLKLHIETLNAAIGRNPVKSGLRAELKRILVVDDSYPQDQAGNRDFPPYPLDIDARWEMWSDYRGDIDPKTGRFAKSAYMGTFYGSTLNENVAGATKVTTVDYALIHEWSHHLFNYQDEYVQNVENHSNALNFRINLAEGQVSPGLTPWFGASLKRAEGLGLRGYYTDPRGVGQASFKEVPGAAHAAWAERPEVCRIKFIDKDGQPLKGIVNVNKVHTEGNYYAKKGFVIAQEANLDNGEFLINSPRWFTPNYRPDGNTIYPTNWYLEITQEDKVTYMLNVPVAMFNLSKIVGDIQSATYTVQFLSGPVERGKIKTQCLDMGEDSYRSFSQLNTPYAKTRVEGTDIDFIWSLEKR